MLPEVNAALDRGRTRLRQKRLAEAQSEFYLALDLSKKDPDVALEIAELWRKAAWGALHADPRDPEAGHAMFHNSRALYKSLGGHAELLSQVLRGMGFASSLLGDYDEATALSAEALALPAGRGERVKVLASYAITLNKLERSGEAQAIARQALELGPDAKQKAALLQTLGASYILDGKPREALALVTHERLRAWAHAELGEWEQVLSLLKEDPGEGHYLRALAQRGLGAPRKALAELLRGARAIEAGRALMDTELGRSSGGGARQDLYALLIDLCLELGREEAAFKWAEAGRARSFLDFIVAGRRDLSHLRPAERERLEARRRQIGPEGTDAQEREFGRALRRYEKEALVKGRLQPKKPLAAAENCRRLDSQTALVLFHWGASAVQAFVLRTGGLRRVTLRATPGELREAAGDLAQAVSLARRGERLGSGAFLEWHGDLLGKLLLGDLPLDGVRRLICVPDGPLHLVPFGALRREGGAQDLPYSLSLAPSASVFAGLAARAAGLSAPQSCLLVLDPTESLDHARGEEALLRERFGAGLTVLQGPEATLEAVREAAKGKDVLHFATHAVYRPERPEFSYLELARGERLHAFDAVDLELAGSRLVTLSACDSGRGDAARAGELMGLPRAFLRAGAAAVLATLWPIEDHPGVAELMGDFYRALGGDAQTGPAEALAVAQMKAEERGLPGSLVGAFVVVGG